MKIYSLYLTLGIVGASAVTMVACTSNTTVNNNGTGEDASTDDGSTGTPEPDSATPDTGTTTTPDTGTTTVPDAGGEAAATCGVALDTGSAECDTCVAASCCTQLTTCDTPDDAGVNEAGLDSCEQLLTCINDINGTDGGADSGMATCDPSYGSTVQTAAAAVLSCIETSCATQCPGL